MTEAQKKEERTRRPFVIILIALLAGAFALFVLVVRFSDLPAANTNNTASPRSSPLIINANINTSNTDPWGWRADNINVRATNMNSGTGNVNIDIAAPQVRINIDEILERLPLGEIVFNAPDAARLNEPFYIQLLLSPSQSADELAGMLSEQGRIETARIRIADHMEAQLRGSAFAITALTPAEQLISRNEPTEWRWEVKALETGTRRLHLTLTALLAIDRTEHRRPIRIFDKTITINVSWQERVATFLEGNWKWFWATFLVPIAVWVWRRKLSPWLRGNSASS